MEEVILFIAKNLAKQTESIKVEQKKGKYTTIFTIFVHPEDKGRIIGKDGKIISSLKTIVTSLANKEDGKIIIKIGENNG